MWKKQHFNLGRISQQSPHTIQFDWEGLEELGATRIAASCGCTKPVYDKNTKKLTVKFVAPNVPKHLLWKKEYTTTKKIRIETKNNNSFNLTFTATIFTK